jgi:hypothetical protein
MTAVAEDLDLSWVTFTDQSDDEPCIATECKREPVAVAFLETRCDHVPGRVALCVCHRDQLVAAASAPRELGCLVCDSRVVLIRVEPIR